MNAAPWRSVCQPERLRAGIAGVLEYGLSLEAEDYKGGHAPQGELFCERLLLWVVEPDVPAGNVAYLIT